MEPIRGIVGAVLTNLTRGESTREGRLVQAWASIVGGELAAKTKPFLGRGGLLHIWVGQSSLASEIHQRYRMSILKRAQALLGESEVRDVRIRVGQLR